MLKYIIYLSILFVNFSFAQNLYTAQILNCYDGDTCRIKTKGQKSRSIRLACIDAPELKRGKNPGQKLSIKSKNFLNKLIKNKTVLLEEVGTDKYRRSIVFIRYKNKIINYLMLKAGLAEAYRGKTSYSKSNCFRYELLAKAYKKGIWALKKRLSPSEFRKKY